MHIIKQKVWQVTITMGMKEKVTNKLLQATSDKTELNKKMLTWNKSFVEVNKTLGGNVKKNTNNK
ncbi:MAG: hypothetical protein PWP53_3512 [Lacrimispora sp.]|nr:hypothetical protein [Lacrimispora sp.]